MLKLVIFLYHLGIKLDVVIVTRHTYSIYILAILIQYTY